MKDLSLIEALSDCTISCGWCVNHCPDDDKYETLVSCIRVQQECMAICKTVNSVLAGRAQAPVKNILKLFEILADYLQKNILARNKSGSGSEYNPEEGWKKPGCSQLFLIAQLLEETYRKEFE